MLMYNRFVSNYGEIMAITNNKLKTVDYNCDLAQSFGVYKNDIEYELLDYVSSVNISCGFHAGDPNAIKKALLACKGRNIAIGAHIGFPDIAGFGYHNMNLSSDEIESIVIYQIGALASFAKSYGMNIEYVRPHGAMYKRASEDLPFALDIAKAIKKFDSWLIYYGAAGTILEKVSEKAEIRVAHELTLDKKYNFDATVNYAEGEFVDIDRSIRRLNALLNYSTLDNIEGGRSDVEFDTLHFSCKAVNSLEVIKKAYEISKPMPVNYKKVETSGWV